MKDARQIGGRNRGIVWRCEREREIPLGATRAQKGLGVGAELLGGAWREVPKRLPYATAQMVLTVGVTGR